MNGAHFAMWVPAVVCCAILAAQAHILKSKRPLSHHIEAHLLTSVDFSSCQGNHFATCEFYDFTQAVAEKGKYRFH